MTAGAIVSVVACGDDDGVVIASPDAGIDANSSGGNGDSSAPPGSDGGATPPDASTDDSGRDAALPPACNDGTVDPGETCDPLASCPTVCPPVACQLRSLDNGGTCAASCSNVAVQTSCLNGDGCCPTDCNTQTDSDCTGTCGDGVVEKPETCDGADCPTACPNIACQKQKLTGTPATCDVACVNDTLITACGGNTPDGCCPSGCTQATDADCAPGVCGNGVLDGSEKCDPGDPAHPCPTSCPSDACNLFTLTGTGCQAECVPAVPATQKLCLNADKCCPAGCDSTTDSDCKPSCGNGVTEPPEKCDGANCPTACPAAGCQLYNLTGSKDLCTAECVAGSVQNACANADGCCPSGCNSSNDNDCTNAPPSTCGNGKLDPGETCDESTGTACPTCAFDTCVGKTGSVATCDLACNVPITTCSGGVLTKGTSDACCPLIRGGAGCVAKTDVDCPSTWNSVTFPGAIDVTSAGPCATFTVTGIEAGSFYDFTTCGEKATAKGDVKISSVTQPQSSGGTTPIDPQPGPGPEVTNPPIFIKPIPYGNNDTCSSKTSAVKALGWTCNNVGGQETMACVSQNPGGIQAKNANNITVTVCGVTDSTTVPFSVIYNATIAPVIKLSSGTVSQ